MRYFLFPGRYGEIRQDSVHHWTVQLGSKVGDSRLYRRVRGWPQLWIILWPWNGKYYCKNLPIKTMTDSDPLNKVLLVTITETEWILNRKLRSLHEVDEWVGRSDIWWDSDKENISNVFTKVHHTQLLGTLIHIVQFNIDVEQFIVRPRWFSGTTAQGLPWMRKGRTFSLNFQVTLNLPHEARGNSFI